MEEKFLKFTAFRVALASIALCVLLPYLPSMRTWHQELNEERLARKDQKLKYVAMTDLEIPETDVADETASGQLAIVIPDGITGADITFENDPVTQTLAVTVPGVDSGYFENNPVVGGSDHIDNISYRQDGVFGVIQIALDKVYEVEDEYDSDRFYFSFLTPHEVYDKVVVIDAGHGGRVPGASKQGVYEKNIDLAIVLALKEIFDESDENIGVYYTRTDDDNPTFDQRVGLANKSDADLFISIHNNSTASGRMSSTSGTQVMYDEESEKSKALAEICLDEVTGALGSKAAGTGLVKGDDIYIIRNSEVPVALIEVGFMTNRDELKKLDSEEYQRQAAEAIHTAILRALDEVE